MHSIIGSLEQANECLTSNSLEQKGERPLRKYTDSVLQVLIPSCTTLSPFVPPAPWSPIRSSCRPRYYRRFPVANKIFVVHPYQQTNHLHHHPHSSSSTTTPPYQPLPTSNCTSLHHVPSYHRKDPPLRRRAPSCLQHHHQSHDRGCDWRSSQDRRRWVRSAFPPRSLPPDPCPHFSCYGID